MDSCVAGIPGCNWGEEEARRGMNYAKQDELLTRHLRWHQVMETRELKGALIALLTVITQPSQPGVRVVGALVPAITPEEPLPNRGSVETQTGETQTLESEKCSKCGFKLGGTTCRRMHEGVRV